MAVEVLRATHARVEAEQDVALDPPERTASAYSVHTMVGLQRFEGVAEITVGDLGEMYLLDPDGRCSALFAPGQWRWVEFTE